MVPKTNLKKIYIYNYKAGPGTHYSTNKSEEKCKAGSHDKRILQKYTEEDPKKWKSYLHMNPL